MSFCATSIPEPTQTFEQPQYILFKSGNLNFENNNYWNDYKVHKLDSLVIIEIKEIRIGKKAVLDDEFHKAQILKELDLYLLRELKEEYRSPSKISSYNELKGSLIVSKKTSITLKLDSHTDYLNFKETRLDGDFKRLSNDNQLLINGHFKNGIEDSVWTFYNSKNEIVSMKYFKKGELIKIDKFDNSKLLSEKTHNTRSETIRYKYFHLALICLFIIALLTKLVLNYKKSEQKDIPHLSHFSKIAAAIGLPLIVLFLAKMISSIIPNSFSTFFISFFLEIIMAYIIAVPLFLIVFYILRLRSKFDLVFYILLFSLTLVLMEEWIYLKNIINEMPT
ncbi:MAG: hypothetical protein JKY33_06515 [Bacteroidia bacterium]|nr:hypothetical protein [Bacteroidia bacterium]